MWPQNHYFVEIRLHSCKRFFKLISPHADILLLTLAKTMNPFETTIQNFFVQKWMLLTHLSSKPAFSFCIVICTISYLYSG